MTIIHLDVANIALAQTDVIVNSANPSLRFGSGISYAIHKAAGRGLEEECLELMQKMGIIELPVGEVVITTSHNLSAKHVIHAVGPVYGKMDGKELELLRRVYIRSLEVASEHAAKSIAFPPISTGIYGFPKDEAAKVAICAVRDYVARNTDHFEEVYFLFANEEHRELFAHNLERFGPELVSSSHRLTLS